MGKPLRIVIDHIAGSRRGQRQELAVQDRLSFGRHPGNDVTFDAHRDLDASSRHAELRCADDHFELVDIGSSNGTFVDGERVRERAITPGIATEVEFGAGGPRLRLFIGSDEQVLALPGIDTSAGNAQLGPGSGLRMALWLMVVMAVAAVIGVGWWRWAG